MIADFRGTRGEPHTPALYSLEQELLTRSDVVLERWGTRSCSLTVSIWNPEEPEQPCEVLLWQG